MRFAIKVVFASMVCSVMCFTPTAVSADPILPTYTTNETDATWTLISGTYQVPTTSENYSQELWERNIEDGKWTTSGGNMILQSDGLYRAYGDLTGSGFGVGIGSAGELYLFLYADVVAPCEDKANDSKTCLETNVGLKGHYYFYFQVTGEDPYLIEIPSGTALDSTYQTGDAKAYQDHAAEVYGTSITTTCESTNCTPAGSLVMSGWNSEIGNSNQIYSRAPSTTRVEVAVPLTLLGLTAQDLLTSNLLWMYTGVATSNPSGTNNLFGNDQWQFAPGKGVEYDTVRFDFSTTTTSVPEPGSLLLLGSGLVAIAARARSRFRARR